MFAANFMTWAKLNNGIFNPTQPKRSHEEEECLDSKKYINTYRFMQKTKHFGLNLNDSSLHDIFVVIEEESFRLCTSNDERSFCTRLLCEWKSMKKKSLKLLLADLTYYIRNEQRRNLISHLKTLKWRDIHKSPWLTSIGTELYKVAPTLWGSTEPTTRERIISRAEQKSYTVLHTEYALPKTIKQNWSNWLQRQTLASAHWATVWVAEAVVRHMEKLLREMNGVIGPMMWKRLHSPVALQYFLSKHGAEWSWKGVRERLVQSVLMLPEEPHLTPAPEASLNKASRDIILLLYRGLSFDLLSQWTKCVDSWEVYGNALCSLQNEAVNLPAVCELSSERRLYVQETAAKANWGAELKTLLATHQRLDSRKEQRQWLTTLTTNDEILGMKKQLPKLRSQNEVWGGWLGDVKKALCDLKQKKKHLGDMPCGLADEEWDPDLIQADITLHVATPAEKVISQEMFMLRSEWLEEKADNVRQELSNTLSKGLFDCLPLWVRQNTFCDPEKIQDKLSILLTRDISNMCVCEMGKVLMKINH